MTCLCHTTPRKGFVLQTLLDTQDTATTKGMHKLIRPPKIPQEDLSKQLDVVSPLSAMKEYLEVPVQSRSLDSAAGDLQCGLRRTCEERRQPTWSGGYRGGPLSDCK